MTNSKGMKPPISYYGGKQTMARHILPLIPKEANLYGEPFAGGAAIFWRKEPHNVEALNDLNGEILNFYQVLKGRFDEFYEEVDRTLYSRTLHHDAKVIYFNPHMFSEVQRAAAVFILANQSYSSCIASGWAFGVISKQKERRFNNAKELLTEAYCDRLKNVQLDCLDALQFIRNRDRAESFFYIDPPYIGADMGHYSGYQPDQFDALMQTLTGIQGKFLMSSYRNKKLSEYVKANGWYMKEIEKPNTSSHKVKGRKKVEVLTANYPIQ